MPSYDDIFRFTMGEEGVRFDSEGAILSTGLNMTPGDPGGTTNFGFAQKFNTDIDVTKLDWNGAHDRAFNKYWLPSGADKLPWPVNAIVFDTAFNQSFDEAKALRSGITSWEDMLWARLAQYAAKHPANMLFMKWWLERVLHLRMFILDRGV